MRISPVNGVNGVTDYAVAPAGAAKAIFSKVPSGRAIRISPQLSPGLAMLRAADTEKRPGGETQPKKWECLIRGQIASQAAMLGRTRNCSRKNCAPGSTRHSIARPSLQGGPRRSLPTGCRPASSPRGRPGRPCRGAACQSDHLRATSRRADRCGKLYLSEISMNRKPRDVSDCHDPVYLPDWVSPRERRGAALSAPDVAISRCRTRFILLPEVFYEVF